MTINGRLHLECGIDCPVIGQVDYHGGTSRSEEARIHWAWDAPRIYRGFEALSISTITYEGVFPDFVCASIPSNRQQFDAGHMAIRRTLSVAAPTCSYIAQFRCER